MTEADAAPAEPIFDVARPAATLDVMTSLTRIGTECGRSSFAVLKEFLALTLKPGRVSFEDYVRLRLFDDAFHAGRDKTRFIGEFANKRLVAVVNDSTEWAGLAADKIASLAYLAAYGFPTPPLLAIYAKEASFPSSAVLASRADLVAFLSDPTHYPLFGKPVDGFQSLGSIDLDSIDLSAATARTGHGRALAVTDIAAAIERHFPSGYLFQRRLAPAPAIHRLCGPRLATLRVLTIRTDEGERVLRACWKIPARGNHADNYWRAGNVLAGIDLATGEVRRAMTGTGFDLRLIQAHPDSKEPLVGVAVPDFDAVTRLALAGARLMKNLPLIGWDIAPTVAGPIIVEMNEAPDFLLPQLADGEGMWDDTFQAFLATIARQAKAKKKR